MAFSSISRNDDFVKSLLDFREASFRTVPGEFFFWRK
jgi:hypothetical protein